MHIKVFNITLRDGEQTPCFSLTFSEKFRFALKLDIINTSRNDVDFINKIFFGSANYGADRFCICDTVGILTGDSSFNLFSEFSDFLNLLAVIVIMILGLLLLILYLLFVQMWKHFIQLLGVYVKEQKILHLKKML